MSKNPLAIIFVSNGPGELATWVKPLARELHKQIEMRPPSQSSAISLNLVLVPCPNANGHENLAAQKWLQFEKIIKAKNFWELIFRPNRFGLWPTKGLVIFLGGDQFWSVLLSARLGYLHMTYAEWIARWPFWNDRILAMSDNILQRVPKRIQNRCSVIGDLTADLSEAAKIDDPLPPGKWIALMPGSKSSKLKIGIPFFLDVADKISESMPNCRFIVPLAPTTNIDELKYFASRKNPISKQYNSGIKSILKSNNKEKRGILITEKSTVILIQEKHPAYNDLIQCDLAITTVGANTAELGALSIPMIVVVPTQHLLVMEAWDGLIGLIARLPILKWCLGLLISLIKMRNRGFMAWPNISAKRMIVPERIGHITPNQIAKEAMDWLNAPSRLSGQKKDLQMLRGNKGAKKKFCQQIINLLKEKNLLN
ncbi:glycosyl transferase [Prochlorococcus marinus]|uniref:Glycosyl transferase n=1 Tax=Prochlorococcus marinus XMU1408 TaxID=2213228 RepID=A0A318R5S9_PROMR|nr:glycosyl transferase [Prochlorococcus marinus]MBW3041117.1 glycosyl transferase [Prochlorococcus marinus str. XMU1408]PYE03719.1 glycosyl transferase [Prochlorococcus marinus XMU1408]